ncbi:MAG TPA: helix-turn-helix transcriptional regulator [Amycolatopsis sp.]|nr:helix-turn-helix transcriptional regulator [Amycolatopsis sp.]
MTNDFGRKLRALRRQRGLTQAELGGDEMSTSYVSLLEAGKRRPTVELALRLAARLDVAPAVLLDAADLPADETDGLSVLDLRYAELALLSGRLDEAYGLYDAFRRQAAEASAVWLEASGGMAQAKERLGELEEATSLYREWLAVDWKSDWGVVASSTMLAGLCRCLRERGVLAPEADRIAQALEAIRALELDATPVALELVSHLAAIRQEQDDTARANALLADAAELIEKAGQAGSLADTYWHASTIARQAGQPGQAMELAECAIATYRAATGAEALARVRVACADVPGVPGRLEAALQVSMECGSAVDIARCEVELSGALMAADPERAHALATAALARVGPEFRLSRAEAKSALGRAAWELGRRDDAIRSLREAADELAELGLVRLSARGLLRVAALQEQDGNVADALAAYRQAAAVAGLAASDRT